MPKIRKRKRSINFTNVILTLVAIALIVAIAVGGFLLVTKKGTKLPETLSASTGQVQEIGKPQLLSEVKKGYAIAVYYPKVDNAKINDLIEAEAKSFFEDLKTKAKEYQPADSKDQLLYKIDYQIAANNDKYLSLLLNIDKSEKGTTTTTYKSYLYDSSQGKELMMSETFTGQYLKKLESVTKRNYKQNEEYLSLSSSEQFLKGISYEDENNFATYFLHSNQFDFYFNPGQLSTEDNKVYTNTVSTLDLKRYVGIDILANLPKDESAVQIPDRFIDPDKPMVALTYDDGPHSSNTPRLLEVLKENDAVATFFVVGNRIKGNEQIILDAVNLGNQAGSHTYDHADLRKISNEKILSELSSTNDLVKGSTESKIETNILRPPYGAVNANVKQVVPYPMIMWNIDTMDWKTRDAQKTYDAVINHVKDGDVILMHDIHGQSIDASVRIIPKLIEMGYQLVTIDELFESKGIILEPGKVYYNALK